MKSSKQCDQEERGRSSFFVVVVAVEAFFLCVDHFQKRDTAAREHGDSVSPETLSVMAKVGRWEGRKGFGYNITLLNCYFVYRTCQGAFRTSILVSPDVDFGRPDPFRTPILDQFGSISHHFC